MSPRDLAILGSTGSIGTSTVEVLRGLPDRFRVRALAAGRNVERLAEQVREFGPELVVVADAGAGRTLAGRLGAEAKGLRIAHGPEGLSEAASAGEVVVNAVVGAAGLAPTLTAVERGARVALANKESLVLAGALVMRRARERGAEVLPVDSEHSGLFQALAGAPAEGVERLLLTASGGPLLRHPDWRRASPAEVLAHPVWAMGARITTDSATLVNKGFEVIEAHALFGVPYDRIEVLVHPQAAVHAIVEWPDGSMIAQLSVPDMRLPIQLALLWPERRRAPVERLDLADLERLTFEPVEPSRFPAFALARAAGEAGGLAPAVLNAADEVLVELFHEGAISLGALPEHLEEVLAERPQGEASSLEAILEADRWARRRAREAAVGV